VKLLLVHNYYREHGGEDDVFASERDLLQRHGHETVEYVRHNDEIRLYSPLRQASLALRTTWAWDSYAAFEDLLRRHRPALAHFHNTFPLISPAAYYACQRAGVPVVQTLHNARLLCPQSNYYRDGRICQDCFGKTIPWPGALHGCYRGSRAQSAVVAAMLGVHNRRRTFHKQVDAYIVGSEFYRGLFLQAGFPAERLHVKPHFVAHDPGVGAPNGGYALFVGRLAPEKGADLLLEAWNEVRDVPLKIRGDGTLEAKARAHAAQNPRIELLPRLAMDDYLALVRRARFLVWPSFGYYETFGRVAIEAFAAGVPVLASDVGANAELVRDGITGMHFRAGDARDLAVKVRWMWEHPQDTHAMGRSARAQYEREFTAERNYEILMQIYRTTLAGRGITMSAPEAVAMQAAQ